MLCQHVLRILNASIEGVLLLLPFAAGPTRGVWSDLSAPLLRQAHDFGAMDDDGGLEQTSPAEAFINKMSMRMRPRLRELCGLVAA
jgi:hypothetical protein